ncbi:DUF3967 domain-containing protein [Bacillus cereus]|uniref:DUF3967 domain-containing protein n=1 Tax=Bacillus cereus group TaxID=86661 RepID=UPI001F1AB6E9|nr:MULTISPECIES: DUF3967 domain-containing protein [Bacillus cereus group]BCD09070.1 hypothetical protein BC30052_p55 [Bacillus cereus]HDR7970136.1 DUF3967 domain-containing protein [Bacillus pacificus]
MVTVYQTTKQAAQTLNINHTTFKKYYGMFERYNGYNFLRDLKGQVMFSEYDLEIFKRLLLVKAEPGRTIEESCRIVGEEFGISDKNQDITDISPKDEGQNHAIEELKKLILMQNNKIDELTIKLNEQSNQTKMIETSVGDRDQQLIRLMKEMLEVKRMVAASEKKKWWVFWK